MEPTHSRDPHPAPVRPAGMPIQRRMMLLVLAVVTPFLVLSLVQSRARVQERRTRAEAQALHRAQLVRARLDDYVTGVEALLVGVAAAVRMDVEARQQNDTLLALTVRSVHTRVRSLGAYDVAGVNLGSSTVGLRDAERPFIGDRPYLRQVLTGGRLVVSPPLTGKRMRVPLVVLAMPVVRDGRTRGVVNSTVVIDEIRELLAEVPGLPEGTAITLLDTTGRVVARTHESARFEGRDVSSQLPIRDALLRTEGTSERIGLDGVRRLSAHVPVARAGWVVLVGVPASIALSDVRRELIDVFLLLLATLAVAMLAAWLVARRLVDPLRALTAHAGAIAAGDLTRRAMARAGGEVGTLLHAFDQMAASLEARDSELASSEQRYRLLFQEHPLPMWIYDPATLRFLDVNDTAVARYGYTRAEFLAMSILDIRPSEEVPVLLEYVQGEDTHLKGRTRLWTHRRKDGTLLSVEVATRVLSMDGQPARLVTALDVTARVRAEAALRERDEQLRQSQKMEAIGQLAGGIAHDFNNLLTAVLGYCDLILGELGPHDRIREDVEEIRAAAERAAAMTQSLLAFSRKQVLQPRELDLNEVVLRMEHMLRRIIGGVVVLRTEPRVPLWRVRADRGQLEQVLLNLVVNARDAMIAGGTLTVATEHAEVTEPLRTKDGRIAPGRYVVLAVRDTGVGIPDDVQPRIFDPFFTTKPLGKGTGLGLSTVYGIVTQSGGHVLLETAIGQGTTFRIYLPAIATPSESPEAPVGDVAGIGTATSPAGRRSAVAHGPQGD